MQLKFTKLTPDAVTPLRANPNDAGLDLFPLETFEILPLERKLIKTGIALEIPPGYEGQIRPRSGLALKQGITVLNTPGTIDAAYRGDVGVILFNTSTSVYEHLNRQIAIAQLVIQPITLPELVEVNKLSDTARGVNGFGSTSKLRQ